MLLGLTASAAAAQVTIHPRNTTPAAWERFTIHVVNGTDTATTGVRIEVPDAVAILGVEAAAGWAARTGAATESAPQFVEWSGGEVRRGDYLEFAFLGRVIGDARQTDLVFPVTLARADGSTLPRNLRVTMVGRTRLSTRGVTALAGTALGLAVIALIVAVASRQKQQQRPN
jgi:uncharacterized protein YcnI